MALRVTLHTLPSSPLAALFERVAVPLGSETTPGGCHQTLSAHRLRERLLAGRPSLRSQIYMQTGRTVQSA
ncbi:hypothetical protein B1964_07670 [Gordonia sp. i37]|nr:hypothetical protein B1964_07670 [Gordonia sp. i37]